MYFNKYPFSQNFSFSDAFDPEGGYQFRDGARPVQVQRYGSNVFRVTVQGGGWNTNYSQVEYTFSAESEPAYRLEISPQGGLRLSDLSGASLLEPYANGSFGKNGDASMFRFQYNSADRFYGAGSKLLPLELSGVQSKFWNTDVWGDFPMEHVIEGRPDPYYVSIPYLIIRTENGWAGLLYNNPESAFISVGAQQGIETFLKVKTPDAETVCIGAESGQPDLFVLAAGSLAELTRTYQQLVGVTPLPPVWSLGYQQCRWGYESVEQLEGLKAKFEENEVPVDGLWLDIDYMDGYRVFTMDPAKIPDPASEFQAMLDSGHPVVPIIDPGVKRDPGYAIYESGKAADVFCKNPEGDDFVGLVWPGMTVFPDFSREASRAWWADQVAAFANQGIVGAWLDMNDPSLGKSNPYDMLFGEAGAEPHRSFHNQYGVGMAKATRAGFEKAHPDKRIFLLTRSNSTGGGKYAAVWTGDNVSSYHYLRMSIPTSLNLALSGIPFNGADVGGFGHDTNPALMRDWMKAACLGAFFRNHTELNSIDQEPWAFDELTLEVCRGFIRLRYLLMPYLYNLFVAQAECGEAIMRPLVYDFESTDALEIDRVDDAYLTGPSILQAPFVDETGTSRSVPLPGHQRWFAPMEGKWYAGNQKLEKVTRDARTSPIYFKEGSIIPLRREPGHGNATDLSRVDLLVVADADSDTSMGYEYVADDGESLAYLRSERSRLSVTASVVGKTLDVCLETLESGFGPIDVRILTIAEFESVMINGKEVSSCDYALDIAGVTLEVRSNQCGALG
ncbi:glycoside hydrolase family 31 protein [Coraliomargarita parva]|uniref:glycoside hydrolase family 31 protein n=1 Tax=Coraliomargarita parva TaxID=3014050 RepID=UPI0022B44D9D|nr:glycoside hydrolase family 31 protein [Coraliomargarita parva]